MSRINYPDVPSGEAGVPIVNIDPNPAPTIAAAPSPAPSPAPAPSAKQPQWRIVDENGTPVITPDSVVSFEYRNKQLVPDYPVEKGGFASYNKVSTPFDIRAILSCGGNGEMDRESFLQVLDDMTDSTDLYTFVTPDRAYPSINLTNVDYSRRSRSGVTLILAQLTFREIRQTVNGVVTTSQPDGAPNSPNGQVYPVPPTASQAAASGGVN